VSDGHEVYQIIFASQLGPLCQSGHFRVNAIIKPKVASSSSGGKSYVCFAPLQAEKLRQNSSFILRADIGSRPKWRSCSIWIIELEIFPTSRCSCVARERQVRDHSSPWPPLQAPPLPPPLPPPYLLRIRREFHTRPIQRLRWYEHSFNVSPNVLFKN
jgi:hypothetical protein